MAKTFLQVEIAPSVSVDEAAVAMLHIAQACVRADFNGTELFVCPGSNLSEAVRAWERGRDREAGRAQPDHGLNFEAALLMLKAGHAVARKGWNGPNQWIHLQRPDRKSKMTLPYFYIHTVAGALVPWLASQSDLLAEDWYVVRLGGMATS